jgi:putative membrane protein
MIAFLMHVVLSAVLLLLVAKFVPGFEMDGFGSAFLAAVVLGLVNALIKPLAVLLSLPLTIITFGLFLIVVNAAMLMITAALTPGLRIKGFAPALWGALLLAGMNLVVGAIF